MKFKNVLWRGIPVVIHLYFFVLWENIIFKGCTCNVHEPQKSLKRLAWLLGLPGNHLEKFTLWASCLPSPCALFHPLAIISLPMLNSSTTAMWKVGIVVHPTVVSNNPFPSTSKLLSVKYLLLLSSSYVAPGLDSSSSEISESIQGLY